MHVMNSTLKRMFIPTLTLLFAAGVAGLVEGADHSLRVATFRCDITPPLGEPIYSSYLPLASIEHPLLAKGIVLEDGGARFVLCAMDWCEVCNGTHTLFREKIAGALGTDASRVAIQTIHQHTAPMGDGDAFQLLEEIDNPPPHLHPRFFDDVADRLARSAHSAVDRLEPFDKVGTGQAKVERVASSRRIKDAQGKILVRWSRCTDPVLRDMPEGKIDPWLKTITLARADTPLVRLHYYATHPQSFYGDPRASYDFPGMARETLEADEGVFQIYFNGCGGDITAGKYNDGSRQAREDLTKSLLVGMRASIAKTQYQPASSIRWRTVPIRLTPRSDPGYTDSDYRSRMTNPQLNPSVRIYRGAMPLAFLARQETPILLSALSIGQAHVVHLPGESMIDFQLFAQQLQPDGFVAVAAYGDCGCGYVCTEEAFAEGGYEPTDSFVVPESEAVLKSGIRKLLGPSK
jgi:hypothetical protein